MSNRSSAGLVASAIALGLLLSGGLVVLGYLLGSAAIDVKSLERTVVVKGLAEREVPADIAIWPVTTQVASNEIQALYDTIQANNATVREYLAASEIDQSDITVNPPVITDLHAQNYGNRGNVAFRYTGSSTITVYSKQVDKVREAISGIIELGKEGIVLGGQNYQNRTQFIFSGLNDIKPAMIEAATRNARQVANKFASDSESQLGKIRSARQGQFSITDRDSTTPHIKKVRVVSTVEYYLSD